MQQAIIRNKVADVSHRDPEEEYMKKFNEYKRRQSIVAPNGEVAGEFSTAASLSTATEKRKQSVSYINPGYLTDDMTVTTTSNDVKITKSDDQTPARNDKQAEQHNGIISSGIVPKSASDCSSTARKSVNDVTNGKIDPTISKEQSADLKLSNKERPKNDREAISKIQPAKTQKAKKEKKNNEEDVVTAQPTHSDIVKGVVGHWWVKRPSISHCPVGLEHLHGASVIRIYKLNSVLSAMTDEVLPNKYFIGTAEVDATDQMYYGFEDPSFFILQPRLDRRAYRTHFEDYRKQRCFDLVKDPPSSTSSCIGFRKITRSWVETIKGEVTGYVIHESSLFTDHFIVTDRHQRIVGKLRIPMNCTFLKSIDDEEITVDNVDSGMPFCKIRRRGGGEIDRTECYELIFHKSLDVLYKVLLVGLCVHMDFDLFNGDKCAHHKMK